MEHRRSHITVTTEGDAKGAIGTHVAISGTAQRPKLGPAIETGHLIVYCTDLDEWPPELQGASITVHGLLEHTYDYDAVTTPDGLQTAGVGPEGVFVLRHCEVVSSKE